MDGYRITIDINDVAEGDATGLAQRIWDEEAESFDAKLGDFKLTVSRVMGDSAFAIDWDPAG
jgi:hypothetical protein